MTNTTSNDNDILDLGEIIDQATHLIMSDTMIARYLGDKVQLELGIYWTSEDIDAASDKNHPAHGTYTKYWDLYVKHMISVVEGVKTDLSNNQ